MRIAEFSEGNGGWGQQAGHHFPASAGILSPVMKELERLVACACSNVGAQT